MSEWKERKLGNITSKIGSGATPTGGENSYKSSGITLIRSQNVQDFHFDIGGLAYIDQEQADLLKNVSVEENDILLNITGESVTRCCLVPKGHLPARVNQHVSIIRPISEYADFEFVYYYLHSIKAELNSIAEIGCTRRALTKNMIENLSIPLPPLPEQRAIAGVLSSLDDKIDLLHRQNKTLEGMAEALWRKMVVEKAGYGWSIAKLGDFCEIQNGYAFKSSEYQEYQLGYLEVLKMGHIQPGGGLRSDPKRDYVPRENKLKRWILNKDDIVLPMTDMKDNVVILGNPALIDKDGTYVLNQRVARIVIKDKSKLVNSYMLYLQMKDKEFISELQSKANSGVQVNLTTEAIKGSEIIIPPDDVQLKTSESIIGYYNKFDLNTQQIRTLSRLRDTLLPKLMSGEVRVKV